MTELQRMYNEMLITLEKGINDLEKFEDGNMSAGTRVRKTMQTTKELAQQNKGYSSRTKKCCCSIN